MESISTIAFSIFLVVVFLAGVVAIKRWLYSNNPGKLAEFRDLIVGLIYEAEEMLGGEAGAAKLDWVILRCRDAGILRWIPEKLLIELVNLSVFVLNHTRGRPWPDNGGQDGPGGPGPGPAGPQGDSPIAPAFDQTDALFYAGLLGQTKRARRPKAAPTMANDED